MRSLLRYILTLARDAFPVPGMQVNFRWISHRPINSTFKSRRCTERGREREEESRGRLRNCVYVLRKRTSPLSNGITRIVLIYSNRLNTSSIAREYRGIPWNFSRMSTTDFLSKMATLPPSLANSFANRKTDFFPRTVTQTVRKISIESG